MQPIGLILPLTNGNNGFFNQSFDSITQIQSNLLNFFSTRPYERRFNPKFGTSLYKYLFEQNIDGFDIILQDVITEDIKTWFPNVFINQVYVNINSGQKSNDSNNYIVDIKIEFTFNNQVSSLGFTVTNN